MLLKRKFLLLCFIISILLFVSSCSGINTQPRFQDQNQDNRGDYMDEADSGKDVAEAGSIKIGGMKEEAVPVQKTDHKKDDAKKDDSNDEIKPTPDSDAEGGNASVSDHSSKNEATKEQASPAPSSDTISSDTKNDLDLTSNNSSSKNEGTKDQASPAPSAGTKSNDTINDAAPTSNSSKNEGTKDQASPAPSSDTKSSVTKDNASPKPGAVSNLKMARASSSTAKLSWTAGSGAASYEVQYYSQASGGWKTDPDYKTKTSKSYTTTGLTLGKEYQFRVRSVNAGGKSDWVTIKFTHAFTYNPSDPAPGADQAIKWAKNQLGKNDWNGYCLAFVSQAYSSAGISSSVSGRLPDAKTAANKYKPVKKGEPPKGAVVFFDWWGTVKGEYANWGHVGIYIGNDKFIHAEKGVKTSTFSSYYMKKNGDYLGWAIWGQ
jgi:cell wall-associated NlpC family hydrolase